MLTVLKRLDPLVKLPKQFIERTVSLQQKIMHLKKLLSGKNKMTFKDIFESAQSKTEVIVSFLALLELVKQRHITLNQNNLFEDIIIEKS
jgi:segregation and condensation protein A